MYMHQNVQKLIWVNLMVSILYNRMSRNLFFTSVYDPDSVHQFDVFDFWKKNVQSSGSNDYSASIVFLLLNLWTARSQVSVAETCNTSAPHWFSYLGVKSWLPNTFITPVFVCGAGWQGAGSGVQNLEEQRVTERVLYMTTRNKNSAHITQIRTTTKYLFFITKIILPSLIILSDEILHIFRRFLSTNTFIFSQI